MVFLVCRIGQYYATVSDTQNLLLYHVLSIDNTFFLYVTINDVRFLLKPVGMIESVLTILTMRYNITVWFNLVTQTKPIERFMRSC